MKTTRFTDQQIIGFLKQAEADMSIKEFCRSGGFSQTTFYKWLSKRKALAPQIKREAIGKMIQDHHCPSATPAVLWG